MMIGSVIACSRETVTDPHEDATRFAEAVCEAAETCGCADGSWSASPCVEHHTELFLAAVDAGLRVERDCFEKFLAAFDGDPCLVNPEWLAAREQCWSMRGDKQQSESCTTHPDLASMRVDECGDGFACTNGVCDIEGVLPDTEVGAPCVPEPPNQACGFGLTCSLDGVCHEYSESGEACDSSWACNIDPGQYCPGAAPGQPSTCQPALELGESCDPAEFRQCRIDYEHGENTSTIHPRWCNPATRVCEEGWSVLCSALADPVNW
jgi:hypothetical protein